TYEYCEEDADVVLIDLVKNFPFLYDKSATDFKNAKKKERTWMEISEYLKLPITDCQNRCQRLREKFSREKKRRELETRSGSGAYTRPTFLLYNNMKFLDSFVKSRKTYTNITPRGTHFISNIPKTKCILQKSKPVETINSISAPSEVLKSSSPLSILSSSSSVPSSPFLSSTPSLSPSINENSSLMQSCIKSTPENKAILSSMQPCIKFMPGNKKNKAKCTIMQEADKVDKSFMNLSSVMSQHFSGKQKMDEDDVFGSTIAFQLRKIEEPRKTQLKGKIMKILYEF
ncbi:uncharacterized protein LOC120357860, partial [Solenopsis invicta]|uniref:uncharacterized protein LOC120357860 n=1 Tax=Solenopsis invicta TaxID=13686 RepID=UPI00193D7246